MPLETDPNSDLIRSAIEVSPWRPRNCLRHLILDAAAWWNGGLRALEQVAGLPRVQLLVLHHVFPDELESFRRLLQLLGRYYRFVSYSEAAARVREGQIDAAYLAISFDDGLKCCRTAAVVLKEFGWTGCFFVCPAILGCQEPRARNAFCRRRLEMPPCEFLDWSDVETLQAWGHEIGGHTMNHYNLARISCDEAQQEISQCREVLVRQCGHANHFAWPYGRFEHFSRAAAAAVYDAGFLSCASGVRGAHGPSSHSAAPREVCLRRDQLAARWPRRHAAYFLAQAARHPQRNGQLWPQDWSRPNTANGPPSSMRAA